MPAPLEPVRLFDYGSLMAGERDHALLAGSKALGPARTKPDFHLVDLGVYAALVAGGNVSVVGELYLVERKACFAIDVAKQCGLMFERLSITLDDGTAADAYVMPEERTRGKRRLKGGSWRDRFAPPPRTESRSAFIEALRKHRG
ncbi:MAG: gamma-glutamylcyclotransferase family protein [Polyangiaceae bacterium]